MARSFSNAKVISTLVAQHVSLVASKRGYSAASQGASSVSSAVRAGSIIQSVKKVVEESNKINSPWIPDPVTGYYKPENHFNDVDVAELREMLLKNKRDVLDQEQN